MKSLNEIICLNLGAGKIDSTRYNQYLTTVHVDQYFSEGSSQDIDSVIKIFRTSGTPGQQILCKSNIFDFIDRFPWKFNFVIAERIFEHLDYTTGEIGRVLEGLNVLTNEDAELEIVVPNAVTLSKKLLEYENDGHAFSHITSLNYKLIINTEFCNFRFDPHLSVWTPNLAKEYIESEGTWKIDKIEPDYVFAGRSIYMKIFCSKPRNKKSTEK